jgi:hypothetical protein
MSGDVVIRRSVFFQRDVVIFASIDEEFEWKASRPEENTSTAVIHGVLTYQARTGICY